MSQHDSENIPMDTKLTKALIELNHEQEQTQIGLNQCITSLRNILYEN